MSWPKPYLWWWNKLRWQNTELGIFQRKKWLYPPPFFKCQYGMLCHFYWQGMVILHTFSVFSSAMLVRLSADKWWSRLEPPVFQRRVELYKEVVLYLLRMQKVGVPPPELKVLTCFMHHSLKLLGLLHAVRSSAQSWGQILYTSHDFSFVTHTHTNAVVTHVVEL